MPCKWLKNVLFNQKMLIHNKNDDYFLFKYVAVKYYVTGRGKAKGCVKRGRGIPKREAVTKKASNAGFCIKNAGLERGVTRGSRERNNVTDVLHAGNVSDQTLHF